MLTTEILNFVKQFDTIHPAKLQLEFLKGYNWADKIIDKLLLIHVISREEQFYKSYYVNKDKINQLDDLSIIDLDSIISNIDSDFNTKMFNPLLSNTFSDFLSLLDKNGMWIDIDTLIDKSNSIAIIQYNKIKYIIQTNSLWEV